MKYLQKHEVYYILLGICLAVSYVTVMVLGATRQLQMLFVITGAAFYIAMGVIHHVHDHDFSSRVLIEYVGFAALGISIVYFLIQVG